MESINSNLDNLSSDIFTGICLYLYGEDLIRVSELNPEFMKTLSDCYFLKKKSLQDFNKKIEIYNILIINLLLVYAMEANLKILPNVLIIDICYYLYGEDLIRVSEMNPRFMKILSSDQFIKKKSLYDFNVKTTWDKYIQYASNMHVTRYTCINNTFENSADALIKASMIHDIQLINLYIKKKSLKMFIIYGAARGGHLDIVMYMIEKGEKNYEVAMQYALDGGHIDVVKLLLEKGVNGNWIMPRAASAGHIDIVKLMLEKGANDYNLAIELARSSGHMDIADLLLSKINN